MPYFDCLIQTDQDKKVRAVCFDLPKRVNLQQAYQQKSPVKICDIKRSSSTSFSNFQDQYKILEQGKNVSHINTFSVQCQHLRLLANSRTSSLSRSVEEHLCSSQSNEQPEKQAAHSKKWQKDF